MARLMDTIGRIGLAMAVCGGVANSALYNVEGGHRAVIFDRFTGIKKTVVNEGMLRIYLYILSIR